METIFRDLAFLGCKNANVRSYDIQAVWEILRTY